MKKKVITSLLTLGMILTLGSVTAFAADEVSSTSADVSAEAEEAVSYEEYGISVASEELGEVNAETQTAAQSLQTALGGETYASVDGDTVTLLQNATLSSGFDIDEGNNVVLNLNGYTLSQAESYSSNYLLRVNGGATLEITDDSVGGTGAVKMSCTWGIVANGDLTISGGTVSNNTSESVATVYCTVEVQNGGTATVTGGTVTSDAYFGTLRVYDGSASVTGGSVTNTAAASSGYTNTQTAITTGTGTDNQCEISVTGGTVSSEVGTCIYAKTATVEISGTNTETDTSASTNGYYCLYLDNATATVTDASLNGGYAGVCLYSSSGECELTVNGDSVISGETFGISTNGTSTLEKCTITINDGTVTGGASGMYLPGVDGETTINGGSVSGENTAIEIRAGSLTVNGGTLTATSETASYNSNGSGTTVSGAAIAVSQHSTNDEITVTINGGELEGYFGLLELNTYADRNDSDVTITISGDAVVTATGTYDNQVEYTGDGTQITTDGSAVYSKSISDDDAAESDVTTTVAISGGSYNTVVEGDYLTDDVDTLATYTVTTTDEEGNTTTTEYYGYYTSSADALSSSPSGAVVTSLDGEETVGTVIKAATCTTAGIYSYTKDDGSTGYKSIPATGHSYSYSWEWSEDYSTATVTAVCKSCGDEQSAEAGITSETTKEATCQEEGSIDYTATATIDGNEVTDVQTDVIAKTDHTAGEAVYSGNCTSGTAKKTIYCTVCDAVISEESIEKTDHHSYVYDENEDVVWTPVYGDDGETITGYTVSISAHCTNCARTNTSDNKDLVAEYTVTTEPTCETEGEAVATVTTARLWWYNEETGEAEFTKKTLEKTFVLEKLSEDGQHSYEISYTEETCTEPAYVTEVCTVCGQVNPDAEKTEVEGSEPLGHDYEKEVTTEATCTEDGVATYTCSRCGDSYTETIEATGHTPGTAEVTPATCTENAKSVTKCTVCGEVVGEEVDLYKTLQAEGLDEEEIAEYKATGHTAGEAVKENEVAATCTEDGSYDEVVYCTVCNEEISRETITVEATGHDYEAVVTPATCKEDGYTTYTCSVCGDTYTDDTVESTGTEHVYGDVVWLREPDCVEKVNGIGAYTCTVCGKTTYKSVSYEDSHEWVEVEDSNTATCTEAGTVTYVCSICYAEKTEDVEATGHTWGEWTTTKEATCGEDGERSHTCSVCSVTETETIEATGQHTWSGDNADLQVSEDDTYVYYVCTTCGQEIFYAWTEGNEPTEPEDPDEPEDPETHTHTYGEPTESDWVWTETEEGYSATVTLACTDVDCDDSEGAELTLTATVTSETKEATCTEDGVVTYTAVAVNGEDQYTSTKVVEIPATGHSYGEPTWTWSEDYATATATFTCASGDDTQTVDAVVISETTAATCTVAGETVYTATVTFNGTEYTATESVEIPATGEHHYVITVVNGAYVLQCSECGAIQEL